MQNQELDKQICLKEMLVIMVLGSYSAGIKMIFFVVQQHRLILTKTTIILMEM
jgi:hypothetical protein